MTTVASVLQKSSLQRNDQGLFATFYGDDFTGSTDVMESFVRSGRSCVLYLDVPDRAEIDHLDSVDVIGVAGLSRSWSPAEMLEKLPPILAGLRSFGAPVFHYKICSTFDSAPQMGSIGCALEIVREIFGTQPIPLVIGAPILKRYTAFGNLFAAADGKIHRIDRHPTMASHSVTPMSESDLRIHLSYQSNLSGGLIDVVELGLPQDQVDDRVDSELAKEHGYVLFDVLDDQSQRQTGRQLSRLISARWEEDSASTVIFGSSGVEYALATQWHTVDLAQENKTKSQVPTIAPAVTLVVTGSRSPVTDAQTKFALEQGFREVSVDPERFLASESEVKAYRQILVDAIKESLNSSQNTIVTTPPKRAEVPISGNALARELSYLVKDVSQTTTLTRLVVAGGDTSGHVARSLDIHSLRILALLTPGAPLCEASFLGSGSPKLQVCLKGGQVGPVEYFVQLAGLLNQKNLTTTLQERALP